MGNRDILPIGTSAGGVEAMSFLANSFRPDFPAAILVTIHLPTHFDARRDSEPRWTAAGSATARSGG
jgi:chemotaxis response regulator CheB